jgi:hypothetical protein
MLEVMGLALMPNWGLDPDVCTWENFVILNFVNGTGLVSINQVIKSLVGSSSTRRPLVHPIKN